MEFNGTIEIAHNPVTTWETYAHTFEKSESPKDEGYSDLQFSQRAEGGFHRASFVLHGPHDLLSAFIQSALGREVRIVGNNGALSWEGYIHSMEYDAGRAVYKMDLGEMANAVWVRFRVRGSSTTSRSATQTDADSIAKYGRKEFVLSAGELESTDIADNIATQYLNLHKWPVPTPTRLDPERDLAEYPSISVDCRGWFDTLNWCTYNQTVSTDNQSASAQFLAIAGDTDVGQLVSATSVPVSNTTSIGKEYDADRRGGDILKDIARVGDANARRWIVYMKEGRVLVYEEASPPVETT